MKRFAFLSVLVMIILSCAGCKKGNVSIKASKIETNTMLIQSDGAIQVGTVEEFKESYYDLDELKDFIHQNVSEFNQEVSDETAVAVDSIEQRDGKAIMVLKYANMDYYAEFNGVEAKQFTTEDKEANALLPEELKEAKGDGVVSKDTVLSSEKLNVVVLNESYDLIVSSPIQYYTNGTVEDEKQIQTLDEGSVVVY